MNHLRWCFVWIWNCNLLFLFVFLARFQFAGFVLNIPSNLIVSICRVSKSKHILEPQICERILEPVSVYFRLSFVLSLSAFICHGEGTAFHNVLCIFTLTGFGSIITLWAVPTRITFEKLVFMAWFSLKLYFNLSHISRESADKTGTKWTGAVGTAPDYCGVVCRWWLFQVASCWGPKVPFFNDDFYHFMSLRPLRDQYRRDDACVHTFCHFCDS